MILDPAIEKYIKSFRYSRDEVQLEMEKKAKREDFPIIGPDVGNLLYLLARISGARSVLEFGSGFGYSAYFFAKAIPDTGRIVCTDLDEKNKFLAEQNFRKGNFRCSFEFIIGDALSTGRRLDEKFDIVYNDIDKEFYPESIDIACDRLRRGGIFITDNTLWSGKVTRNVNLDEATKGVVDFNNRLGLDKRFEISIIPLRDGVTLAVKK